MGTFTGRSAAAESSANSKAISTGALYSARFVISFLPDCGNIAIPRLTRYRDYGN